VKAYLAAWPAGSFAWALGSLEHPICLQLGLWRRDGVAALWSAGMAALVLAYTAALATGAWASVMAPLGRWLGFNA
jgi:hypothetical protein